MSYIHTKTRRIAVLASLVFVLLAGPAKPLELGLTPNQVFATWMNINAALEPLGVAVAAASEEASANVQTVASATEEMTASISEINTQVSHASEVSKQAVENVDKTSTQMEQRAQLRVRSPPPPASSRSSRS